MTEQQCYTLVLWLLFALAFHKLEKLPKPDNIEYFLDRLDAFERDIMKRGKLKKRARHSIPNATSRTFYR